MKTNPNSSIFNIMGHGNSLHENQATFSEKWMLLEKWSRKHCRTTRRNMGEARSFGMTNWWWRLTDAGDADFAKRRRSVLGRNLVMTWMEIFQRWWGESVWVTVISSNGNHKTGQKIPRKKMRYLSYIPFFWTQPWYDCLLFTQDVPVISEFCCHHGRNGTPAPGTPARVPQRLRNCGAAAPATKHDPRSLMKLATASPAGSLLARPEFRAMILACDRPCTHDGSMVLPYMLTFTINIPPLC